MPPSSSIQILILFKAFADGSDSLVASIISKLENARIEWATIALIPIMWLFELEKLIYNRRYLLKISVMSENRKCKREEKIKIRERRERKHRRFSMIID